MIKFFGCSYTEGGGLDNINYYNFLKNENLEYYPSYIKTDKFIHRDNIVAKLEKFKFDNRFTEIINKELNGIVLNLAVSQSSNDFIFEKLFKEIENNKNEVYFVILSIFHRRYWFYDYDKKKYNLNMPNMNGEPFNNDENYIPFHNHYLEYLKIIFNLYDELETIFRNIKLFNSFAKEKNSKIIWSVWELDNLKLEKKLESLAENTIKFDGLYLKNYCVKNQYQIHYETNGLVDDNHITLKGNQEIAKIFINYIKENNLI